MGQLEDILKHQNMVRNNIMKSFGAETSEDSLEKSFEDEVNPFEMEAYKSELTKAELDEFEKAKHQDGDMHPNGKWVWRQSANGGKGDWRVAKTGGSKATAGGAAAANTKTNTAAKTSSSTLSDKEKNAFADIMKKNSSHKDAHMNLEQMSDDELRKFANAASVLAGDKTNLNDKTRANIKGWMKLAQDEQTARRNNKKTTAKKTDNKNSEKPYIYNDGGMVGGKTQIKDEAGLLKVLNNSKSNTVLIYDKDWKGLNSEAKNIGEKNGWDVTVDVDKDGNISSTGSYIMFKKKKEDKEIPNAAQVSISNIIRRTFGKNLSSLKFKGKKVIINVDGKAYGSGYSSYVKSSYKDGKMTSRELENSYDKSSMDTVEKKLGTLIKYVNQIELIENYD